MRKLLWIPAVFVGLVAICGASDLIQAPDVSKAIALIVLLAITILLAKAEMKNDKKKSASRNGGKALNLMDVPKDEPRAHAVEPGAPDSQEKAYTDRKSIQEKPPFRVTAQITPPSRYNRDEAENKRPLKGESIVKPISYYVALDIETTGLSPSEDEIIELSAVRVHDNVVVDQFSSLVKPSRPVSGRITELTGITNDMLADAPPIEQALPAFRMFIGDYPLIGHNVNFDINFLYDHSLRIGLDAVTNDFLDTLRLSRQLYPGEKHHRLSDLIERFGIGDSVEHRALSDVMQTKACYDVMRVALKERNPKAFPDVSEGVPGAMDIYFRGEEHRKAGEMEEALALFDDAKSKGYESPALYISYAMVYRKQKDYQKEIDVLTYGIARMEARHYPADALLERKAKTAQLLSRKQAALSAAQETDRAREEKKKVKEAHAAEPEAEKKSQKRAILQLDMDMHIIQRFESIAEAVRVTGINSKSIRDAANGIQKRAGGFMWKYDE